MTSIPTRLGTPIKAQGTTHALLFTGTTAHLYLFRVKVKELTGSANAFSVYIAANSWTSGLPTGSTLVVTLLDTLYLTGYQTLWTPMAMLSGTQKIVVVASAASAFDISAYGTDET